MRRTSYIVALALIGLATSRSAQAQTQAPRTEPEAGAADRKGACSRAHDHQRGQALLRFGDLTAR